MVWGRRRDGEGRKLVRWIASIVVVRLLDWRVDGEAD